MKVSSLKVDFHCALDEFLHGDYGWVHHFKNLEKLVLKGPLYNLNDEFDVDDVIEEFCQKPLSKLKEFQNLTTNFYMTDKFLM